MDGVDRGEFEAHADHQRLARAQAFQRAVEKTAAVAEAIALRDRSRSSAAVLCPAPIPRSPWDRVCRACPSPCPLPDAIRGKSAAPWARPPPAVPRSRPARAGAAAGGARRTHCGSASRTPPRPWPGPGIRIANGGPWRRARRAAGLRAPPVCARAVRREFLAPGHQFSVLHIFDASHPSVRRSVYTNFIMDLAGNSI